MENKNKTGQDEKWDVRHYFEQRRAGTNSPGNERLKLLIVEVNWPIKRNYRKVAFDFCLVTGGL